MSGRDLAELTHRVETTFDTIHREVFRGDPVANPRLHVEVRHTAIVRDTPTLALITPWTINGLAFPPDDEFPERLILGGRRHPVFAHELPDIGPYRSVNFFSQTAVCRDQAHARLLMAPFAEAFHAEIARIREHGRVPDPGRRRFLRGGRAAP